MSDNNLYLSLVFKKSFQEDDKFFFFDVEASNENLDLDEQSVLQRALLNSKDYFLTNGVISKDHLHTKDENGRRITDEDFVIGEPVAVYTEGKSTRVKGKLYKSNGYAKKFIELLKAGSSRVKASVGGLIPALKGNKVVSVLWNDLALTIAPVNHTVAPAFAVVKALSSGEFVKALSVHKYSKREWKNGEWVYTYPQAKGKQGRIDTAKRARLIVGIKPLNVDVVNVADKAAKQIASLKRKIKAGLFCPAINNRRIAGLYEKHLYEKTAGQKRDLKDVIRRVALLPFVVPIIEKFGQLSGTRKRSNSEKSDYELVGRAKINGKQYAVSVILSDMGKTEKNLLYLSVFDTSLVEKTDKSLLGESGGRCSMEYLDNSSPRAQKGFLPSGRMSIKSLAVVGSRNKKIGHSFSVVSLGEEKSPHHTHVGTLPKSHSFDKASVSEADKYSRAAETAKSDLSSSRRTLPLSYRFILPRISCLSIDDFGKTLSAGYGTDRAKFTGGRAIIGRPSVDEMSEAETVNQMSEQFSHKLRSEPNKLGSNSDLSLRLISAIQAGEVSTVEDAKRLGYHKEISLEKSRS